MANNNPLFYNFLLNGASNLRRYRWTGADFAQFQQLITDLLNGCFEGLTSRAVLQGFEYQSATGLNVTVGAGYGVSASGYFMAQSGSNVVNLPAPSGAGNSVRHLVVARPLLTETNYITSPTNALTTIPKNVQMGSQVVVVPGVSAANPDYNYAATGANDVILFGVRLPSGASSITDNTVLDTDIRDSLGRNNNLQNQALRFDNRLRPYRSSASSLGLKPAQSSQGRVKSFLYTGASTPSSFPRSSSGSYNGDAGGDTFLNFKTGAISGGDQASSAFTPTIPSAGNSVVALVTISTADVLSVAYGTPGTYAQCKTGIVNQTTSGAGGVPVSSNYKVAYVVLTSSDGVNITEMDVIDARGMGANYQASTTKATRKVTSTSASGLLVITSADQVIEVDASAGAVALTLPSRASMQGQSIWIDRIDSNPSATSVTVNVNSFPTDSVEGAPAYFMDQGYQSQEFFGGSTAWKVRG